MIVSRSSISFCSDKVFSRTMRTISCCHRKIAFNRKVELDRRRARRVLDGVRNQIVDDGPDFLAVADDDRRRKRGLESEQARKRGQLVLTHHSPQHVDQCNRTQRLRLHAARLMIVQQILDQLLQRQGVFAHDAHNLLLLRRQFAPDAVAQQLGAFAHRGQRRLELVGDVPQKAILLLLELAQPRAQPFETLAEVAHVLRAIDLDRMGKVRPSHLPDRLIELADRSRDQHRKQDGERQRDQSRGERKVAPSSCSLRPLSAECARSRARSGAWSRSPSPARPRRCWRSLRPASPWHWAAAAAPSAA